MSTPLPESILGHADKPITPAMFKHELIEEIALWKGRYKAVHETADRLQAQLTAATEALEKAKAELDDRDRKIGQLAFEHDGLCAEIMPLREQLAKERERSGKREAALREALLPFARFHRAYKSKPMRGVGDEFYGIHSGTEWEANLKHSDMARADAALSQQAPTNDTTK